MAEPNEVIGVSPAQLLFGNSIQLDRGIFLPQLPAGGVEAEVALSDWADRMLSTLKVQDNICSGNEIWRIWSSSMVFRHTLTWAHMY